MMASELHSIKLRLEEKRRNIEAEKRKVESAMNRQKQSVGKQAFLQAMGQVRDTGAQAGCRQTAEVAHRLRRASEGGVKMDSFN